MNLAQQLADVRFWERDDRPEESLNPYREVAGLCWTAPSVADREMDPALADVFARALRAATLAERERCAKVAELHLLCEEDERYDNEVSKQVGEGTYYNQACCRVAAAIRQEPTDGS